MVGLQDEGSIKVTTQSVPLPDFYLNVNTFKSIDSIFTEIGEKLSQLPDEIEITFKAEGREITTLSSLKGKTLYEAGIWPTAGVTDYEMVVTFTKEKSMVLHVSDVSDDELLLGASASPTTGVLPYVSPSEEYPPASYPDGINSYMPSTRRNAQQLSPVTVFPVEHSNYVGLVNQAMTCYLNSLLQALYMTPEFRNALYNWEFDGANETRSIPYQLQKLFLNLQTSLKSAVETTDLTTSFGWQGSDAWHQHDIQELCRVMFDALEQKFKDTKQANLINDLYEGKMLDYVKCLECSTEKSREDTFLDIPLPVRPFGSTVAYNSVEEALRAFVQPETLDGNNQYFCEKCNKKCDAHKGLKFTKFPYLLTLHLKRFDFDYNTMHRIKLNDKVVFPEILNLNSFIPSNRGVKAEYTPGIGESGETLVKCDDCSTTDSGSADDESCQGTDLSSTVNGNDDNCGDSDEGIDVSSGTNQDVDQNGPYVYELFSIMIHSGSASGGHYYAYVKDFDKNLWFCFNDQSVTSVTVDDIKKTYGGGPHRSYYSGAYSSSTNAYMLMYRQIDKARNCSAMTVDEFPPHIQQLLKQMRKRDEEELMNRQKEDNMVKINVCYWHPSSAALLELKMSTRVDMSLLEIAQHALRRFKLDGVVAEKDCRLIAYDKQNECILRSFESDDITYQEAVTPLIYTDWMLEIREPGTEWKTYKPGGIQVKVYPINLETEEIDEPRVVRVDVDETVGELKQELGQLFNTDPDYLEVVLAKNSTEPKFLIEDTDLVPFDFKYLHYKIYVANAKDTDPEVAKRKSSKLARLVQMYGYVISLDLLLPETDEGTLDSLSIPSLDCNQNVDKQLESIGDRERDSPSLRVSPQPGLSGMGGDGYDQSNSEDSSLSDSDRTLIGDAPVDCVGLSSDSTSAADQYMGSPSDPCQDTYNHDILGVSGDEMYWDQTDPGDSPPPNYYFKVSSKTTVESSSDCGGSSIYHCKVMVDRRMTLEMLKKHLEPVLRIPSEYFKVFKCFLIQEEWTRLNDSLRCMKDGERLVIKLGKVLKEDECQCRVFHITPHKTDPSVFLLDQIITKNETVESVKRNVLRQAKKQHKLDIPYNRCRLREKCFKRPKKVYLDDQKFGDEIITSSTFEMYLQELAEPETVTSDNQVVVFLRRFSPSELTLGPFQEVVLDYLTMDHLRSKISELTAIPLENLDVAHVKGNYPFDMHILEVNEELEWNPKVDSLEQWPLIIEDGSMIFYKDNREPLKELTVEEKRDLRQKEDARLGRVSIRSSGKERALKIYLLDNSPSKLEDDID